MKMTWEKLTGSSYSLSLGDRYSILIEDTNMWLVDKTTTDRHRLEGTTDNQDLDSIQQLAMESADFWLFKQQLSINDALRTLRDYDYE